MRELFSSSAAAGGIVALLFAGAWAQSITPGPAASTILPHCRQPAATVQGIRVTGVSARVEVLERVASTTLEIELQNPTSGRLEAEILVPVPDGSSVKSFAFHGSAAEARAVLLPRDEARRTYDGIVAKLRDPALLEFIGYSSIRSSVFPVEAGGTQKVRIAYEHIVPVDGPRIDYILPRSESLEYEVPWKVDLRIESRSPISTVYSPTHAIEATRGAAGLFSARLADSGARSPGAFQLSALLQGSEGVSATVLAYPDVKGGGYFLLLAGVPDEASAALPDRRDVTLVIDRSGSMRGEKIEQAREAALQVLAGLSEGESFNIIAYDDGVTVFSRDSVVKNAETAARAAAFIRGITVGSGTNIHDALVEAANLKPREGALPIVLFLTDGIPTVGQTSESAIRSAMSISNSHAKRVFTFGVGADVNTHLLEKLAADSRAAATFVLPGQAVEAKVSQVFARLQGPVLERPALAVSSASGESRGEDVLPSLLPDLFRGDQLVAIGRYRGSDPLVLSIRGTRQGSEKVYTTTFDPALATVRHAFVPRLWASRKIGVLVDGIRELGAAPAAPGAPEDPRLKELTGEIVRLSTEFGILTEYTAFLAAEGTDLTRRDQVLTDALFNCRTRAVETRSGVASLNQSLNSQFNLNQTCLNRTNDYLGADMNVVRESRVQQVNDLAFFRKGNAWIDSRVYSVDGKPEPRRKAAFGSPEYTRIMDLLAASHRQGCASLRGDVMVLVEGELVLLEGPKDI